MKRIMLKSKIHRATVTESNLDYEGSVSVDPALCEAADLLPFEKVEIYNCNNGERFGTYIIHGKSREICLNGAAARKVQKGDVVIIASYVDLDNNLCLQHTPKLVYVNEKNQITKVTGAIDDKLAWKENREISV